MRIAACFLALALIVCVFAQEFKGVTYKKPAGWDEAVQGDAKIFAPHALKEGEVLAIIITGSVPSVGSNWAKQFTDTIALANDGGKVSEEGKMETREGSGMTYLLQTLKLDHKDFGKHGRLYAQVSKGSRCVFVTVLIGKDSLMEKYGAEIVDFIGNLGFKSTPSEDTGAAAASGSGKIPTGNAPDLFPGSVGWLPSGRGVPIPAPTISNGKPVGLWWKFTYDPVATRTKAIIHIYLADGTRASNPRLGGGMIYDLAGQRAQKGNTGVGTFEISGGQIVERYDGFENKAPFTVGSDSAGKLFKIGGAGFHPLLPMTNQTIVGQWKGPGADYKFNADGTYETGMAHSNGDWAITGFNTGTYVMDGHLIMLMPKNAPRTVNVLGKSGNLLIMGDTFYEKR
ncbi:MAG: hypothetical protein IT203_03945 [Fimbriimonadaceae bacterium]|nr:hypothetical protein [Fimbriimonadaceae bacterium]